MESIYLMGSEEVSKAASRMTSAAEDIKTASYNLANSFEMHQRFMTYWLEQFQNTVREAFSNVPD